MADQNRIYSVVTLKALDADKRIVEGVASTPTPDRTLDVIEPMGGEFSLPLPFLWQHNSDKPIGTVETAKATKNGITFRARIANIEEPGELKSIVDRAWQTIKAGLVRGVSVGIRILEHSVMENGGWRISKWEWLELSAVTIPANAEATITAIKSADLASLAASGHERADRARGDIAPGVSGSHQPVRFRKDHTMAAKTVSEQIAALENSRTKNVAKMEALAKKWDETGLTADAAEQEEFDTAAAENVKYDDQIKRLKVLEATVARQASAVIETRGEADEQRRAPVSIKAPALPKGTAFARYAMAVAAGRGSLADTLEYAKRWAKETPEVGIYIKAVAGSTLTDSGEWGNELVYAQNLASEFVELLRPMTIIGRLPGIRTVPFNVRIPTQSGGSTIAWVGERAAKPVSELEFGTLTLGFHKTAGIVVLTEELVRMSNPAAEALVRQDLLDQSQQFLDEQFLNSSITATASRPASITQGVSPGAATGVDADALRHDINVALGAYDAVNMSIDTVMLIMRQGLAGGIGALTNALGQPEFPGVSRAGGSIMGLPMLVSNSAPAATIVIVKANEILLADDGRVTLDASREATLDMAGGDTPVFSLFQKNCVALRAERGITWKKRRAEAVAVIGAAAYGPVSASA